MEERNQQNNVNITDNSGTAQHFYSSIQATFIMSMSMGDAALLNRMYSLNNCTSDKLAGMGLGMGLSCINFRHHLLDRQIDPEPSQLLQLTMECGYKSFKTDVLDWYKLGREMRGSLKTPSALPVHIDVGVNYNRKKESRILQRNEGQKVHTRTVRFNIGRNARENDDQRYSKQCRIYAWGVLGGVVGGLVHKKHRCGCLSIFVLNRVIVCT